MEWIAGKEKLWAEHGYGPWAFLIDGKFAGWGGLFSRNISLKWLPVADRSIMVTHL